VDKVFGALSRITAGPDWLHRALPRGIKWVAYLAFFALFFAPGVIGFFLFGETSGPVVGILWAVLLGYSRAAKR
jgi:hypothetical protein